VKGLLLIETVGNLDARLRIEHDLPDVLESKELASSSPIVGNRLGLSLAISPDRAVTQEEQVLIVLSNFLKSEYPSKVTQ
jgi:hypothetical protein